MEVIAANIFHYVHMVRFRGGPGGPEFLRGIMEYPGVTSKCLQVPGSTRGHRYLDGGWAPGVKWQCLGGYQGVPGSTRKEVPDSVWGEALLHCNLSNLPIQRALKNYKLFFFINSCPID